MKKISSTLFTFLAFTGVALTQTSYLDTSFGTNGVSNTEVLKYIEQDLPHGFCVTDSGKIVNVALGSNENDDTVTVIAKYNADGSLDTTFANNGTFITSNLYGADVICENEDIFITGVSIPSGNLSIVKLNNSGILDSSFGANGMALLNILGSVGQSIKKDSNGKFIVAGRHINILTEEHQIIVTRFNSNGNVDNSFGSNGFLQVNLSNTVGNEEIFDINLDLFSDNGILVTGTVSLPENGSSSGDNQYNEFAIKANSSGALDATFGNNGFSIYYNLTASGADVHDSFILPNNKIIMSVNGLDSSSEVVSGLIRLNTNGSIDNTFGSDGILNLFNYNFTVNNLFESNLDNDIYVLGEGIDENLNWVISLVKINEDGEKTSSFAENGVLPLSFPNMGEVDIITNGIELIDGKILVSGHNEDENGFFMGRFFKENQLNITETKIESSKLFPNPVSNQLNIRSSFNIDRLKVYQIDGKLVYNQPATTNSIDVSSLNQGLYIVKIISENHTETFKFNKL